MTHMNYLQNRNTHTDVENRLVVAKWGVVVGERDGVGGCDQQMQTIIYRMDKQQSPTVEHRELYSVSYSKP